MKKEVAGARKYFVHTKHQQQFFRKKKHIVKNEEKKHQQILFRLGTGLTSLKLNFPYLTNLNCQSKKFSSLLFDFQPALLRSRYQNVQIFKIKRIKILV